jgi:hypothetical protein
MAEPESRAKRYDNPQKAPKRGGAAPDKDESAAKAAAEKTAGHGMPHPDNSDKAGKVGSDPGPEGGKDATWGVVAARHKQEHADMLKRHAADHVAHANSRHEMVARHHDEAAKMHARHAKELMEATAGSPQELGNAKSEAGSTGHDGSEP